MIDLNGRQFSPVSNSDGGRVKSDTVFTYEQSGHEFTACYSGGGVSDGHIIGVMKGPREADIIYHSRAKDGTLEAGHAQVLLTQTDGGITMDMCWSWLNGRRSSGTSQYKEII